MKATATMTAKKSNSRAVSSMGISYPLRCSPIHDDDGRMRYVVDVYPGVWVLRVDHGLRLDRSGNSAGTSSTQGP